MRRYPVNKQRAARKFRSQIGRTKAINIRPKPMRGGFRLT